MILSMQPFLSVVIPSYNELANIERNVLQDVLDFLEKQTYTWEIILSDDGSTDGTVEKLREFAEGDKRIMVVENIHAGKAPTVRAGMNKATGKWRLFTDFDQSTPLHEVQKLFKEAERGCDVVIGSREIEGALRDKEPLHRHLMGKGFNFFVRLMTVPGLHDTQCGFKLFSQAATEVLFSKLVVYDAKGGRKDAFTGAFDVELLFLARKFGFRIAEVPIKWKYAHSVRVSPLKDSVRMFRDIIHIRVSDILGKYE